MGTLRIIRAAGGLITRKNEHDETEVLLVHRSHREDWTFPKGKLEPGESAEECALREVEEETGLRCRLGRELPRTSHIDHKGRLKIVRYWTMQPIAGSARPQNEIDAIRWTPLPAAVDLLTYERDRALLTELGKILDRSGPLAPR
jgi:8-oxo-dGTP pyrophosphatase MutT (NUDIX family)